MATRGDPGSDGTLFRRRPLDPPDRLEEAARLHFQQLQEQVFEKLQIDVGGSDPNAPHGWAFTLIHLIAAAGPEKLKSVCFGLIYALLAQDWERAVVAGYWDYFALLRTLDDHSVAVRTLLALAQRFHMLHALCQQRVLTTLGDMAEAFWPQAELVFLALQREVHPGDARPTSAGLLESLLHVALTQTRWLVQDGETTRLTFLWAMRWASALRGRPPSLEFEDAGPRLRKEAMSLVELLWDTARAPLVDAGPALLWALMHCREEPAVREVWCRAAQDENFWDEAVPQDCLDHLVSTEEQEQLAFLVRGVAAERQRAEYFQWFAGRHLGVGPAQGPAKSDAHLADIVQWALCAAEGSEHMPWPGLWAQLLALAGRSAGQTEGQAHLAFLFAARRPGYGRAVLRELLAGSGDGVAEARGRLLELAQAVLPARMVSELSWLSGGT